MRSDHGVGNPCGGSLPVTDGVVSGVKVTIENNLLASSLTPGSAAFIEKKFSGLAIVTAPAQNPRGMPRFLRA